MSYTNAIGPQNNIESRLVMLTQIMDEVITHDIKTGAMTPNEAMIQATREAGVFKIATATTQGLGTYSKTLGYPMGKATLTWQEYRLRYDRSRGFMLDNIDIMQSGGIASATYMFSQFMKQHVIPEIDALRIAGVAQRCIEEVEATNVAYSQDLSKANDIVTKVRAGLNVIFQKFHTRTGNIIYMDYALKTVLENSKEFSNYRSITGPNVGSNIDMWVDAIDGNTIVWMPSDYMKTEFTLKEGAEDTDAGGLTPAPGAKSINFLITAPGVCNGLISVKNEKFIPNAQNILADADFIALRVYHDVIVMKEKAVGLYMSVKEAKARAPAAPEATP